MSDSAHDQNRSDKHDTPNHRTVEWDRGAVQQMVTLHNRWKQATGPEETGNSRLRAQMAG